MSHPHQYFYSSFTSPKHHSFNTPLSPHHTTIVSPHYSLRQYHYVIYTHPITTPHHDTPTTPQHHALPTSLSHQHKVFISPYYILTCYRYATIIPSPLSVSSPPPHYTKLRHPVSIITHYFHHRNKLVSLKYCPPLLPCLHRPQQPPPQHPGLIHHHSTLILTNYGPNQYFTTPLPCSDHRNQHACGQELPRRGVGR